MNINLVNLYGNDIQFKSRSPQIREAQDIVHIINSQLQYSSPMWFDPIFRKYSTNIPISELEKRLRTILVINKYITNFMNTRPQITKNPYSNADSIIQYLKTKHTANCSELATLACTILQMNGYKNVYAGPLAKDGKRIDHAICYFNSDFSTYNSHKITNKTIFIDVWSGIVGFAKDVLKDLENVLIAHGLIKNDFGKFSIGGYFSTDINLEGLNKLRRDYPEFILPKYKDKYKNK